MIHEICLGNDSHIFPKRISNNKHKAEKDTFNISIFLSQQILTQENWNQVMHDGMRATSKWAALYFIALMAVGYYVLFNLLVAILVEGFTSGVRRSNCLYI